MNFSEYISIIIILLATTLLIVLMYKTNILKDDSTCTYNKPYSLSRSQLAFWTLIIFSSIVFIVAKMDFVIEKGFSINDTALLLLGISGTSAILGKTIDASDIQSKNTKGRSISRHQDEPSQGFMIDILSDANGISIHRFQNVIFTIFLMISFVVYVVSKGSMPEWDTTLITLMGISSAGYLGVKINENR